VIGRAARLCDAMREGRQGGVDDGGGRQHAGDHVPQTGRRDGRVQAPPDVADQSFDLVDGQLVQLEEPRLVLAHGGAQRRVGRHADVVIGQRADVVEVGDDLLPAIGQLGEEDGVLVGPPARPARLTATAPADVERVRVPVQPEHSFAGEREVGVVERLAVTEADERVKHRAQCLFSAEVTNGGYQVAVRLQ